MQQLVIYRLDPAKEERFHTWFRDNTKRIMLRLGFDIVAIWSAEHRVGPADVKDGPTEEPPVEVVYLLSWPDRASMEAGWARLTADPEQIESRRVSDETNGPLLTKIENRLLFQTDYSPAFP